MAELEQYAAQLGWLHATPKGEKSPRIDRMDAILPDVTADWVAAHWQECGTVDTGAMGAIPLSWESILGWQVAAEIPLPPWERIAIRRMSVAYVRALHAGAAADCPPPYHDADAEARQRTAAKVRAIFGGRAQQ